MKRGSTPEPERTRLLEAAELKAHGEASLRAAIVAARKAGGSIRDLAELSGLSTNTIQRWLKEKA